MLTNSQIVDILEQTAQLCELNGGDTFKVRNYANLAFTVDKLSEQLHTLTPQQMAEIQGLGKSNIQKIEELITTGTLQHFEELKKLTPLGIRELLRIKGLGPKKVLYLWKEAKVEDPQQLLQLCKENLLVQHKGFGAKVQEAIRQNLEFYFDSEGFILYANAESIVEKAMAELQHVFGEGNVTVVSTFRRQVEVINHLAFVIIAEQQQIADKVALLQNWSYVNELEQGGVCFNAYNLQIKLYSATKDNFAKTILECTGDDSFINQLKTLAGYDAIHTCTSETQIFEKLNLQYVHPALRESASVIQQAQQGMLPQIIVPSDIKGVIHNHSTYSDGAASLKDMAEACQQKGYQYLVISDHSAYAAYAQGLSEEQIIKQHAEIDKLNAQMSPFKIFKSIECDILPNGDLDYNDDILGTFDIVIASIHANLSMDIEKATQRVLAAIENPFTSILGHMTGRLLLERAGYPLHMEKILDACMANDVVLELNASPYRLDIDWRWIRAALDRNILISINPDAHSIGGIDAIKYGVLVAQKAGLKAVECLSAFDLYEFEDWVQMQQQKRIAY